MAKALSTTNFGEGVDPSKINAHTAYLSTWVALVAKKATAILRPKYGQLYGFEFGTPSNAKMVAASMSNYR